MFNPTRKVETVPDCKRFKVGDKVKITMPYSEVCVHLHVAGKIALCEILSRGVQLYKPDSEKFSFPILHDEAGFYQDNEEGDTEPMWCTNQTTHPLDDCLCEPDKDPSDG